MNLGRFYGFSPEAEIPGGTSIFDDGAVEPEIEGRAGGGVDAHVTHGAANHQIGNGFATEPFQQSRLAKAVGIVFGHQLFARQRRNQVMNLRPCGFRQKKRGPRTSREVLYVKDRRFGCPELLQELPGMLSRLGRTLPTCAIAEGGPFGDS